MTAKPESPGCIHTIESGRAYAHGPWCDVLRALEARAEKAEANSNRLRTSLKSALVALNRVVMRGDTSPMSYYKGRAKEVRAALRGKP